MTHQDLATALRRAETVLRRRPDLGMQPDTTATSRWQGGTRVVTRHAIGTHVDTDMPSELGGSGDCVSPGWLFRAAIGSCAATSIVMAAASAGLPLGVLEVEVNSRSDARGLLGMREEGGTPIAPGPLELQVMVRIGAIGVEPARLHALVDEALRRSPIPCTARNACPMSVQVEVVAVVAE